MGDASMSQQAPMPDPNNDPNAGVDLNSNMDNGMLDPNAMAEDPMGGNMDMGSGNPNKDRENIQKSIGKACNDFRNYQGQDKEDLGKWISGMLDSLDGADDENAEMEGNPDSIEQAPTEVPPMPMESVILSKKKINEIFG